MAPALLEPQEPAPEAAPAHGPRDSQPGRSQHLGAGPAADAAATAAAGLAGSKGLLVGALVALKLGALLFVVLILTIAVVALFTNNATIPTGASAPSAYALKQIPPDYLRLYQVAGLRYGIDWAVLAGIGLVESGHGRSNSPGVKSGVNFAGCCAGPMQFYIAGQRSTWASYGADGDGDGQSSPYDPADAIPAAARYLRASGAPANYRRALFAYNHSDAYVSQVLEVAERYRGGHAIGGASARDLLRNPRVELSSPASQRGDLARGEIDRRLIALLQQASRRHTLTITSLKSDHSLYTRSGNLSNHASGRAVDLGAVDGERCTGTRTGACGELAVELATLEGPVRSTELIYCFDPDGGDPRGFAAADHCDHIHAGYSPSLPEPSR